MEVTEVEAVPLASPVESTAMQFGAAERDVAVCPVVVRVHTDAGPVGLGETLTYDPGGDEARYVARGVETLADRLVGEDPRDATRHWERLYVDVKRSGAFRALSALDEALWDLAGKAAGEPCYRLLGGEAGDVAAYATFPHRRTTDELIDDAAWLSESFDSMKITVGGDVAADRERIAAVAGALPSGFGLSIDANTSYSVAEALRVGRTADEHELEWFEEPIAHTDVEGQARLNARLDVPIAAYQSHRPHYPALDHLRANALEVYQPSLYLCGGLTAARRVATLVEAFNERLVPHAYGPLVNYAASLHLAAAAPACDLIEFAVYDVDADDPGRYVASPYVADQGSVRVEDDGSIRPPEGPGLGVELDENVVEDLRLD